MMKNKVCHRVHKWMFWLRYYLYQNKQTIQALSACQLSQIQPYQTKRWYLGDDSEGTIRKYYTALYQGEKCFVKLATKDSTIKNEIFVNTYITEKQIDFVPKTLLYDYDFGKDTSLLVTQFLEGLSPFSLPKTTQEFERICREFLCIYNRFAANSIIHSDVSTSNLLLNSNHKLVVTDFGIGRVPGSEQFGIDYIAHAGNYYITKGSERTYDDMYSFIKMLDHCGIQQTKFTQESCYQELCGLIGKNQYTIAVHL